MDKSMKNALGNREIKVNTMQVPLTGSVYMDATKNYLSVVGDCVCAKTKGILILYRENGTSRLNAMSLNDFNNSGKFTRVKPTYNFDI